MKRNHVNAILVNQTERRNTVLAYIIAIVFISLLALSFFLMYVNSNKSYYVTYDEKSNIDYKVYLKENDFFDDEYLKSNRQYIANLIDHITANFEYNLSLDEKNVDYKYSYRIEANVDVRSKGTNYSLYNTTEELISKKKDITSSDDVRINESVNIDYNHYNDLIKKFVDFYELDDIVSTLNINMYVNVVGSCEDFEENNEQESVMTLSIPLTTKTVAIDISNDLIDNENSVMQCKKTNGYNSFFIIMGVAFVICDLVLIVCVVRYEIKTRTAENIYEKELKKILNNYSSYIQKLNNDFDFKGYQLLKIDTFTDLLEIRDTVRQPILMKENNDKTGAYFVIPSNSKILYVYRLKVSDIKKKIHDEF